MRASPSGSTRAIARAFHALIDEVIDSGHWSEGEMTKRFEAAWEAYNGAPAVATG